MISKHKNTNTNTTAHTVTQYLYFFIFLFSLLSFFLIYHHLSLVSFSLFFRFPSLFLIHPFPMSKSKNKSSFIHSQVLVTPSSLYSATHSCYFRSLHLSRLRRYIPLLVFIPRFFPFSVLVFKISMACNCCYTLLC